MGFLAIFWRKGGVPVRSSAFSLRSTAGLLHHLRSHIKTLLCNQLAGCCSTRFHYRTTFFCSAVLPAV